MEARATMGTSITITDLDPVMLQRLESEARRRGVDVVTLARELLHQAAAPVPPPTSAGRFHHDLDSLAGTWTDAEARAFEAAVADFERIDRELWK